VFHEAMLTRVVLSPARDPAARGLHIFHASLWVNWSPRPEMCPPFSFLISSRSSTLPWRTAVPTGVNSRSRRARLGALPCANKEGERRLQQVSRTREHVSTSKNKKIRSTGQRRNEKLRRAALCIPG